MKYREYLPEKKIYYFNFVFTSIPVFDFEKYKILIHAIKKRQAVRKKNIFY